MRVINSSHYFTPFSRVYNEVPDTNSFQYESSRRNGYFQRIYFEHLYTSKIGGQTFFYTLTYNDKSIPTFQGFPSFKYEDVREITYGYLPNHLLRDYGSKLRFFLACERGEGKGKRGKGFNPHYHIIFFIQPANNPKYEYKKINPKEFRSLVRYCWQGAENVKFQDAKFGICKEGQNLGLVASDSGADCFHYVGKYVTKDSQQQAIDYSIAESIRKEIQDEGFNLGVLHYYMSILPEIDPDYDYVDFTNYIDYEGYLNFCEMSCHKDHSFLIWLAEWMRNYPLFQQFNDWYNDYYVPYMTNEGIKEYRNRYSSKPRMSKGLGEYGLNFIQDIHYSPRLVFGGKDGHEVQYPCLYYIRKLYYTPFKCTHTGNILYRLNELGRCYKKNHLDDSIRQNIKHVNECLSLHYKYDKIIKQDPLDSCIDFERPCHFTPPKGLQIDSPSYFITNETIRRYCIYNIIYRYRVFDIFDGRIQLDSYCSSDNYTKDYSFFLSDDVYSIDYQEDCIYLFLSRIQRTYLSFSEHPAFRDFISDFNLLDDIVSCWSRFLSDNKKSAFSEKAEHLKRIKAIQHQ